MTTLGAVFLPEFPPERLREVSRVADSAGLDELWLWEDCFYGSGSTATAAVLGWTERLRVGIGVLPVPLRNAALMAMEIATLSRLFPGRVAVGVGHGVQAWMAQAGAKVASPMTLLRENLTVLRPLLRGDEVTTDGRYVRLDGVALAWPPAQPAAVLAAATGPKTMHLVGELADGTILTARSTPEDVREARRVVDEGRAVGARTDTHPLIVYLLAATGDGGADRMAAERRRQGYAAIPDTAAVGDARAVAAVVEEYAAAGADTVVLQPTADEPDPAGFVRFVAEEVRALVR